MLRPVWLTTEKPEAPAAAAGPEPAATANVKNQ